MEEIWLIKMTKTTLEYFKEWLNGTNEHIKAFESGLEYEPAQCFEMNSLGKIIDGSVGVDISDAMRWLAMSVAKAYAIANFNSQLIPAAEMGILAPPGMTRDSISAYFSKTVRDMGEEAEEKYFELQKEYQKKYQRRFLRLLYQKRELEEKVIEMLEAA